MKQLEKRNEHHHRDEEAQHNRNDLLETLMQGHQRPALASILEWPARGLTIGGHSCSPLVSDAYVIERDVIERDDRRSERAYTRSDRPSSNSCCAVMCAAIPPLRRD